jgi:hypothetical protein
MLRCTSKWSNRRNDCDEYRRRRTTTTRTKTTTTIMTRTRMVMSKYQEITYFSLNAFIKMADRQVLSISEAGKFGRNVNFAVTCAGYSPNQFTHPAC